MDGNEWSFRAPEHLDEACWEVRRGALPVGGGTLVSVLIKNRLVEPTKLVWLGKVANLNRISLDSEGRLRVGAAVTLKQLAESELVQTEAPALALAASVVGNPRVRAVATVGGALVHGDARQDLPPVLLALQAQVVLAATSYTRSIALDQFLRGWMETALDDLELVAEVVVPRSAGRRASYVRFNPSSRDDYPTVGVAIRLDLGADGYISDAAVALGGVGPTALLVPAARALLAGTALGVVDTDAVASAAREAAQPTSDPRGPATYKKAMVEVWTKRTLLDCLTPRPG